MREDSLSIKIKKGDKWKTGLIIIKENVCRRDLYRPVGARKREKRRILKFRHLDLSNKKKYPTEVPMY